jgi:hypothetical protein
MDFGNGRNLGVRAAAVAAVFRGAPQWRRGGAGKDETWERRKKKRVEKSEMETAATERDRMLIADG